MYDLHSKSLSTRWTFSFHIRRVYVVLGDESSIHVHIYGWLSKLWSLFGSLL